MHANMLCYRRQSAAGLKRSSRHQLRLTIQVFPSLNHLAQWHDRSGRTPVWLNAAAIPMTWAMIIFRYLEREVLRNNLRGQLDVHANMESAPLPPAECSGRTPSQTCDVICMKWSSVTKTSHKSRLIHPSIPGRTAAYFQPRQKIEHPPDIEMPSGNALK